MSRRKQKLTRTSRSPLTILAIILVAVLSLALVIGFLVLARTHHSLWHHRGRLNFVWGQDPTRVVSLIPSQELLILEFPSNSAITAARGYSQYPLTSLWKLAELEQRPNLVAESVQQFLAVPLAGWLTGSQNCPTDQPNGLKNCLTKTLWSLTQTSSSFSLSERFILHRQLKKTNLAQIKFINLGNSRAAQEVTLPDGQVRLVFNQELIDSYLEQKFYDPKAISDNLTANIVNTTSHPGLANQAARLVSHLGVHVISTSSNDQNLQGCLLETSKEHQSSATVKQLSQIFNCRLDLNLNLDSPRFHLQLLLGQDYWQEWQDST